MRATARPRSGTVIGLVRLVAFLYVVYMARLDGPLLPRVALASLAAFVAVTCVRWTAFAVFVSPFLIQLAVYDAQRAVSPARTGIPIDVTGPRDWELAWFGIHSGGEVLTPAEWWQQHTWWGLDLLTGCVYLGFMAGFVLLALWWRFGERRPQAAVILWSLLGLHLLGYLIHIVHPTAPPWYVDAHGTGTAVATAAPDAAGAVRFDRLLGVRWFESSYGDSSSVFGALPSLHVGQTFLALLYAFRFGSLRALVATFFGLVLFASVYLDHHYLVDGITGMALAAVVFGATVALQRRWTASRAPTPVAEPAVIERSR